MSGMPPQLYANMPPWAQQAFGLLPNPNNPASSPAAMMGATRAPTSGEDKPNPLAVLSGGGMFGAPKGKYTSAGEQDAAKKMSDLWLQQAFEAPPFTPYWARGLAGVGGGYGTAMQGQRAAENERLRGEDVASAASAPSTEFNQRLMQSRDPGLQNSGIQGRQQAVQTEHAARVAAETEREKTRQIEEAIRAFRQGRNPSAETAPAPTQQPQAAPFPNTSGAQSVGEAFPGTFGGGIVSRPPQSDGRMNLGMGGGLQADPIATPAQATPSTAAGSFMQQGAGAAQAPPPAAPPPPQGQPNPNAAFADDLLRGSNRDRFSEDELVALGLRLRQPGAVMDILRDKGKLTETQTKDALYAERILRSETDLRGVVPIDQAGRFMKYDPTSSMYRFLPDWNVTNSKEWQQYSRAAREGIAAILRRDTGAAVTDVEWQWYFPMYYPQPGDSAEVVVQKQQARIAVARGLRNGSGQAFDQMFPQFNEQLRARLTQMGANMEPQGAQTQDTPQHGQQPQAAAPPSAPFNPNAPVGTQYVQPPGSKHNGEDVSGRTFVKRPDGKWEETTFTEDATAIAGRAGNALGGALVGGARGAADWMRNSPSLPAKGMRQLFQGGMSWPRG